MKNQLAGLRRRIGTLFAHAGYEPAFTVDTWSAGAERRAGKRDYAMVDVARVVLHAHPPRITVNDRRFGGVKK